MGGCDMWRLGFVIPLIVLTAAPSALTSSPGASFAFTTFDAPFPGTMNTQNNGINNLGISVGEYCVDAEGGMCHAYRRSAQGVFTLIDPPGAIDSFNFANDINIKGVIVSPYRTAPGPTGVHCFVLNAGVYTTIDVPANVPGPFLGGFGTRCRGINDQGQIVGGYRTPGPTGQVHHGFLLSGGVWTPIDVPGAAHTDAVRINNLGQIVGSYVQNGVVHGFLFDGAIFTTIDFPAAKETFADGINNKGQIVGVYRDANNYIFGFIRTPNTEQNLPGPLPPATYTQIVLPGPGQNVGTVQSVNDVDFTSGVGGINDRGQISGDYWGIDNHVHGFVTAPRQDFEVTGSAVIPSANPGFITGVFEGDPIGEGSFTLDVRGTPAAQIPWGLFVFCGLGSQAPLVLTTSTGDQIFVDLLVTPCQTAFPPVPSTGVVSGIYRITSGTGRFGGASGSGFVTGTFEFPAVPSPTTPGTLTVTLEGTISR